MTFHKLGWHPAGGAFVTGLKYPTLVCRFISKLESSMVEMIIEKPSMQKVIHKLEKPSEELAFGYYIQFISSHAFAIRQRNMLNDDEWGGWLQWMRSRFKTISEQWKQMKSERWLNPEDFVYREIAPVTPS